MKTVKHVFVVAAIVSSLLASLAQQPVTVGFGVFPLGPLGPPPCLQSGDVGGRTDPCSYKLHIMVPSEVTILENEEVAFQIHGGGHALAIYRVRADTTREDIGQYLCPGVDPATIGDVRMHSCALNMANANAPRVVGDGHGGVVAVLEPNLANTHPHNRAWYVPGRLMSAGSVQFLNGGTTPEDGEILTYQFDSVGRYVVVCMNRSHFANDWMFGFVKVEEK